MPGATRRLLATVAAVAALVALTGCGVAQRPVVTVLPTEDAAAPTRAPVPSPSVVPVAPTSTLAPAPPAQPAGGAVDCSGGNLVLDAGSPSLTITGDCADVQVNGSGLRVDASAADVAALTLSGNAISVTVRRAGQLSVRGNDIAVSADDVSMFDVQGDRNTLIAAGGVGGVSLRGNDNSVRAGSVGQVSDQGDRNTTG